MHSSRAGVALRLHPLFTSAALQAQQRVEHEEKETSAIGPKLWAVPDKYVSNCSRCGDLMTQKLAERAMSEQDVVN
jgi:hypothetical protein